MALSGLGGDELFAGYPVFNRMADVVNNKWIWNIPQILRSGAGRLIEKIKPGITGTKLRQLLESGSAEVESVYPLTRQTGELSEISRLLNNQIHPDKVERIVKDALMNGRDLGTFSKVSVAEISTYMQNVLLRDTDQMSMASALEVRVPFLDYQLVEYVMGIDDAFKKPLFPKKLLVDSMGDLLPSEIVHRPKMGFSFPWQYWIKNELRSFCDERILSLSRRPFINGEYLLERWKRFLNGDKSVRWPYIWIGVVLEDWLLENNIEKLKTDLSRFNNKWYSHGGSPVKLGLWHLFSFLFFLNHLSFISSVKVSILRLFGAKVGMGVVIKQGVRIKYPWLLEIGNHAWIGECCWIENHAKVTLGDNVCLSQGAMLLCGNHDYKKSTFDLMIGEIKLEDGVWIGAKAMVCPGVTCRSHSVLSVYSVASTDLEPWAVYRGNPAVKQKDRLMKS
jgi:acetyltransferase-like isoleucine patch superfamily enzyme